MDEIVSCARNPKFHNEHCYNTNIFLCVLSVPRRRQTKQLNRHWTKSRRTREGITTDCLSVCTCVCVCVGVFVCGNCTHTKNFYLNVHIIYVKLSNMSRRWRSFNAFCCCCCCCFGLPVLLLRRIMTMMMMTMIIIMMLMSNEADAFLHYLRFGGVLSVHLAEVAVLKAVQRLKEP